MMIISWGAQSSIISQKKLSKKLQTHFSKLSFWEWIHKQEMLFHFVFLAPLCWSILMLHVWEIKINNEKHNLVVEAIHKYTKYLFLHVIILVLTLLLTQNS